MPSSARSKNLPSEVELYDIVVKKCSDSDLFLKYGFVSIISDGIGKLQCVGLLCMKIFSSESKKASKLKRHLEAKHTDCKDKDLSFFKRIANCMTRSRTRPEIN